MASFEGEAQKKVRQVVTDKVVGAPLRNQKRARNGRESGQMERPRGERRQSGGRIRKDEAAVQLWREKQAVN